MGFLADIFGAIWKLLKLIWKGFVAVLNFLWYLAKECFSVFYTFYYNRKMDKKILRKVEDYE